MKKFKGNRSIEDIKRISEERGCWVDDTAFKKGEDWISIGHFHKDVGFCVIIFYITNGIFIVNDEDNELIATHKSKRFDNEEWYKEILELVYL